MQSRPIQKLEPFEEGKSRPPSRFKKLEESEFYSRLRKGDTVYILFWAGMSDIDEIALKYSQGKDGSIIVWANNGNDKIYELDFTKSRTAFEGILLNRWELTQEEFNHFSKLKATLTESF